jgi:hypothetical protein
VQVVIESDHNELNEEERARLAALQSVNLPDGGDKEEVCGSGSSV